MNDFHRLTLIYYTTVCLCFYFMDFFCLKSKPDVEKGHFLAAKENNFYTV